MWRKRVVFAEERILVIVEGAPFHQAAESVADVTRQDRYACDANLGHNPQMFQVDKVVQLLLSEKVGMK